MKIFTMKKTRKIARQSAAVGIKPLEAWRINVGSLAQNFVNGIARFTAG
jgi:hypothetical protein